MQFKVKDFLTKYGFNGVWLGYQRLESRILLALYDETVAGLDQLPEVERTILTRQYIEGEYQPIVRDELGLKSSAYYRRQIKARRHLADALNEAPTFQRLEISFTP